MESFASRTVGLLASGLLLGLAACSTTSQPTTRYPVAHRGIEHSIERGVIVSAKEVIIDGQHSAVGIYTGAGVGGAVGSTLGSGTGSVLTSAAGAVAGAIGGAKVERELTSQKAQELIVRIEGGRDILVVQDSRNGVFVPGEEVQVVRDVYGNVRILAGDVDPYSVSIPDADAYMIDDLKEGAESEEKGESDDSFLYE